MAKTSKNAWLEYDWKLDGGDARFRVDMSLYTNAPIEGCAELVFIYCASLSEQPLKAGELRRIDSLIEQISADEDTRAGTLADVVCVSNFDSLRECTRACPSKFLGLRAFLESREGHARGERRDHYPKQ